MIYFMLNECPNTYSSLDSGLLLFIASSDSKWSLKDSQASVKLSLLTTDRDLGQIVTARNEGHFHEFQ